jgi:hypothetical protein
LEALRQSEVNANQVREQNQALVQRNQELTQRFSALKKLVNEVEDL